MAIIPGMPRHCWRPSNSWRRAPTCARFTRPRKSTSPSPFPSSRSAWTAARSASTSRTMGPTRPTGCAVCRGRRRRTGHRERQTRTGEEGDRVSERRILRSGLDVHVLGGCGRSSDEARVLGAARDGRDRMGSARRNRTRAVDRVRKPGDAYAGPLRLCPVVPVQPPALST